MMNRNTLERIRSDFPFFEERHSGKPIIYLDSACMALKPVQVLNAMESYYKSFPGCAGRSAHIVAKRVEEEMAKARKSIGDFIGGRAQDIIFTRNTTEGINLLAHSLGLKRGDEVIISDKEHNSNLIPWLYARETIGIKVVPILSKEDNTFDLERFENSITGKTKFASFVFTSNMDGVTNPIKDISKICHDNNVIVHFDGAQAVPHKQISVRETGADFLTFSGHKMMGPTGMGVLWGREDRK